MIRLEERAVIQAPVERCFDLARSVEVHLEGNIHYGEAATAGTAAGLLDLGAQVTWRAKHFGVWHELTSRITAMDRPSYFQDVMLQGPFRSLRHDHRFRSLASGATEMTDVMLVEAPFGALGRLVEIAVLRRYMRSLLRERIAVIRRIAESLEWRRYLTA